MSGTWQYQIRIYLGDELASVARNDRNSLLLRPLTDILKNHNAALKCQFDAFSEYVSNAEKCGKENFPLYKWTKATIEDPFKKEKYIKSFTLYVNGQEVYSQEIADALERDLEPLVDQKFLARMTKHDTNPANNPQAPAQFRS
ncbi:MAG TPA: hypothetical protein VEK34_01800 [Methylocella sp.]|nr:hypothetical protein [Methylocella sp.]